MKDDASIAIRSSRVWMSAGHCKLDDFKRIVARQTDLTEYPLAQAVQSNVPIYDGAAVRAASNDEAGRKAYMAEWAEAMLTGPGIVVFKSAFPDLNNVDEVSAAF